MIVASQVGICQDDLIAPGSEAQAGIGFANLAAILAQDERTMANVVRPWVDVTARGQTEGYGRSRDRQVPGTIPTTTLIMVTELVRPEFVRPEFVVEIEAIAAAPKGK